MYRISWNGEDILHYVYDDLQRQISRNITTGGGGITLGPGYALNSSTNTTSSQINSWKCGGSTAGNAWSRYWQLDYTYDNNGNIRTIKKNGVLQETYTYDSLNQLTRVDSAVENKSIVYSYDAGGNITSRKEYAYTTGALGAVQHTDTYTYGNGTWKDLLTAYNGQAITYDGIGNPLSYRDGMSFTWQSGRQLSGVTRNGAQSSYQYNGDGIRTQKVSGGVTTQYYLDGSTIVGELRGSNKLTYVYEASGQRLAMTYNGAKYFYIYNAQGDVVELFDASARSVAKYAYDAWGNPVSITDGNGNDVSGNPNHIANINPFRYRGYYYDAETGFYYVSSRYYDPAVGRWINADGVLPASGNSVQGYNLFAYCMNNPVNMSDPTGNWPEWLRNIGNAIVKAAKTVVAVFTSLNAEAGLGTGFRAGAKVMGVEATAGYKFDIENIKLSSKGVDIGKEEKLGVTIGFKESKHASISIDKGFFHSDLCKGYDEEPNHQTATCPNTIKYDLTPTPNFEIVGIDIYCFIGVSASIGWDYKHFSEEFVKIWYE